MINRYVLFLLFFIVVVGSNARTLEVGTGHPYANPALAARDAVAGDTIHVNRGTYNQTYFIENLHGTAEKWITIWAVSDEPVFFTGASESLHLSDCSYVEILNLKIFGQTGNGLNIDDGGTSESPSHHIRLSGLHLYDIAATGNNDLLKMSGVDSFEIYSCEFKNGSAGGSGLDMVGCHAGIIANNTFTNMGSNAIQAKGGTAFIEISHNTFTNCGERALNLGGSTGLQFFRPLNAPYEAADLLVYANLFEGGNAHIAYVGSTRVEVANNTFIHPVKWVMRILQETVDATRFVPCGHNTFRNNLVVTNGLTGPHVNIGPNTEPETFLFQTNLWWDEADTTNTNVSLPSPEIGGVRGKNPLRQGFGVRKGSPAIAAGTVIPAVKSDYWWKPYGNPPSIGAFEAGVRVSVDERSNNYAMVVAPNPASEFVRITGARGAVSITDMLGNVVVQSIASHGASESQLSARMSIANLPSGIYFVRDDAATTLILSVSK